MGSNPTGGHGCLLCCVLSGRGLCDELITRPEESYRLWCVAVRDQETSRMRRPWPALGRSATGGKKYQNKVEKSRVRAREAEVHAISYCICDSYYICFLADIRASDLQTT